MTEDRTEQEVKLTLVDPGGYEELCTRLGSVLDIHSQENLYFDTPSRALHKAGAMLRVRIVGDRVKVTAKSGATIGDGVLTCREVEVGIGREVWESWREAELLEWDLAPLAHVRELLNGEEPLVLLGSAQNERRFFAHETGVTLEVDRTTLPGGIVHVELEAETDSPAVVRAALETFLQEAGFSFTREVIPKVQRFLNALDRP